MAGSSSRAEKSIFSIGYSAESSHGSNASASTPKTKLNPLASEWSLAIHGASEEDRSLFITFSEAYPLSEHEITWFFNQ